MPKSGFIAIFLLVATSLLSAQTNSAVLPPSVELLAQNLFKSKLPYMAEVGPLLSEESSEWQFLATFWGNYFAKNSLYLNSLASTNRQLILHYLQLQDINPRNSPFELFLGRPIYSQKTHHFGFKLILAHKTSLIGEVLINEDNAQYKIEAILINSNQ